MEKLFTVAGTATNSDGTTKARFANDLVSRVKILQKNGCKNINLMELPHPMTKLQALQFLVDQGITEGEAGEAVSNKLSEKITMFKEVKAVTTESKTSTRAKTSTAPSMESIKAKAARKAAETAALVDCVPAAETIA
jgi:hypothetical protein